MKRKEIEAIVNAYNNLISKPDVKIYDIEWKWINKEDYEWLKPLMEGQKKLEYTIGGLEIEIKENMMPKVMKNGEMVYICSRHLWDLHDIIEWLMFNYKRIKLDVLKERLNG